MQPRDYKEWDDFLRHAIARVSLLNEVVFSQEECEQVKEYIKSKIKEVGLTQVTRLLTEQYPHIYVTFLAKYSSFDDQPGLWKPLAPELGIQYELIFNHHWGVKFVELIQKMGLRDFKDLNQANQYYTCIRIHGGIPVYFLEDFFRDFIQKAIEKPSLRALDAKDLIETYLTESHIAKSTKFYIQNSGEIGVDFVQNCLHMARQYAHDPDDFLDPKVLGLPAYVVAEYVRVMHIQSSGARQARYITPKIYMDTQGAMALYLPSQPIAADEAVGNIVFQIQTRYSTEQERGRIAESPLVISADLDRFGGEILTVEQNLPLSLRAPYLDVELLSLKVDERGIQEQHIRTWHLSFAPSYEEPPLLVFNHRGDLVHWNQSLEADSWVLLYPLSAIVTPEGKGFESETLDVLGGAWQGWQAHTWDLTQAHGFLVEHQGQVWAVPIQESRQPSLVGGTILPHDRNPLDTPLYIGEAPRVQFPIRSGGDLERQLAPWHIFLYSLQTSLCKGIEGELQDLAKYVNPTSTDGKVEVSLADYLGRDACGTFQVRALGPLNIQQTFNFRLWTDLKIVDMPLYVLPGGGDERDLTIHLHAGSQTEMKKITQDDDIRLLKGVQGYSLTVGSAVSRVDLVLETTCRDKRTRVRVPLYLTIPRLLWNVSLLDGGDIYPWSDKKLNIPVERLLQAPQAGLSVELPGMSGVKNLVELFLARIMNADLDFESVMLIRGKPDSLRGDRLFFNLLECQQTIKQSKEESLLGLVLKIPSPDGSRIIPVPVVDLVRSLDIRDVKMDIIDEMSCRISWQEEVRLHQRNLMIWSPWMPWEEALHFPIPDTAKGELVIANADKPFPKMDYRIGFYVAYSWDPNKPAIHDHRNNLHKVLLIIPEEQLSLLDHWIQKNPKLEYQYRFERACVYDTVPDQLRRDQEITWCFQNIQQFNIDKAIHFYEWLGECAEDNDTPRDLATQSAVRMRMFTPDFVGKFYQTFPDPNHPIHKAYLDIFTKTNRKFLRPETCMEILGSESNIQVVLHALKALLEKEGENWTLQDALNEVIKQLKLGKISLQYAEDLLKEKELPALAVLADLPPDPVTDELIVLLSRLCPEQKSFITKGFWYKTPVGWGKIDKILDQQNNPLPYIRSTENSAIFHIILHPELAPLPAIVSFGQAIMSICSSNTLYICTHCREFVTQDLEILRKGKHNHPELLMQGRGAGFGPSRSSFIIDNEDIVFSIDCPYKVEV